MFPVIGMSEHHHSPVISGPYGCRLVWRWHHQLRSDYIGRIQEVCIHMCVCVCVRQCVTSRKPLSADLHNALFPLSRSEKQASFARQEESLNQDRRQYSTTEPPVATIKEQKCETKGSVIITPLLPCARYHMSNGKILRNFESNCYGVI